MSAITTVVMLPVLLIVLSTTLELGSLRVVAARARSAADLAALVAVNDQDDAELARTGRLRLADDAAEVAREYFARNLELSAPLLAGAPADIARSAEVAAFPIGSATDPRTGARYDWPTVRLAATVPLRTPVLGAVVLQPVTAVTVLAVSSAR